MISQYTVSQVIPGLTRIYVGIDDTSMRPAILILLSEYIAGIRDAWTKGNSDSEREELPLIPYKDDIISLVSSGVKVSQCRSSAIACLLGLVSIKNFLTAEELRFIVHSANEILQEDESEDTMYVS
jgi:DNA repair/transcription protein MET18/MMS19